MTDPLISNPDLQFRFSGHESFACRYAWLPKAYRAIAKNPSIFSSDEEAMVELGIGKNMVKSLRFWVDVTGIANLPLRAKVHELTPFAHAVFGAEGLDRFLEHHATLWLLHWNITAHQKHPIFAWYYMLGLWSYPDFTRTEALAGFRRQSDRLGYSHSDVTLAQHLDVFMHTYFTGKAGKVGIEDSIDGPLVDLRLVIPTGERQGENGRWEPVYSFRKDAKPEITPALFAYCVVDFWNRLSPDDKTLTFRSVMMAPGSPGQAFKLPESQVRGLLEEISRWQNPPFTYQPSAIQGLLTRRSAVDVPLTAIYGEERLYA